MPFQFVTIPVTITYIIRGGNSMIHSMILFLSGLYLLVFGYFIHITIIGLGLFFLINGLFGFLIVRYQKHRALKETKQTYIDEILY
jgi:type III secretory pathway component EscU